MIVLHGDNEIASRNELVRLLDEAKAKGVQDVVRFDARKVSLTDLIQATQASSLFGTDKLILVEKIFVGAKSKAKTQILDFLKESLSQSSTPQIIIWENKLLTASQLKSLGNPPDKSFKLSKHLFSFMDALAPGKNKALMTQLHLTLEQEAAELIFAMLVRQVRLLIQAKDNALEKVAPWQQNKLRSQAQAFSLAALVKMHRSLLDIDYGIKSGTSLLNLEQQLDLWIAKI